MAIEILTVDGVVSSTGLAPADVATFSGEGSGWAIASNNNTDVDVYVSIANPVNPPINGTSLQLISVNARRTSGSGTDNPSLRIEVWNSSVLLLASGETPITSDVSQTVNFDFDATILAGNPNDLHVKVFGTKSGGSPAKRSAVDIDYIKWEANTAAADVNVEVDVTTSTLNLTPSDTTIVVEEDVAVVATTSLLNLAKTDPTVDTNIDTDVSVSVSNLNLTKQDTTVVVDIDTDVTASTATLNLSKTDTTVVVEKDTAVTATTSLLNLNKTDPTVDVNIDTEVIASTSTLDIAKTDPVVDTNIDTEVLVDTSTLNLTTTITTIDKQVNVDTIPAILNLSATDPTVDTNIDTEVTVSSSTLDLTKQDTTIATDAAAVSVSTQTLNLSPSNTTVVVEVPEPPQVEGNNDLKYFSEVRNENAINWESPMAQHLSVAYLYTEAPADNIFRDLITGLEFTPDLNGQDDLQTGVINVDSQGAYLTGVNYDRYGYDDNTPRPIPNTNGMSFIMQADWTQLNASSNKGDQCMRIDYGDDRMNIAMAAVRYTPHITFTAQLRNGSNITHHFVHADAIQEASGCKLNRTFPDGAIYTMVVNNDGVGNLEIKAYISQTLYWHFSAYSQLAEDPRRPTFDQQGLGVCNVDNRMRMQTVYTKDTFWTQDEIDAVVQNPYDVFQDGSENDGEYQLAFDAATRQTVDFDEVTLTPPYSIDMRVRVNSHDAGNGAFVLCAKEAAAGDLEVYHHANQMKIFIGGTEVTALRTGTDTWLMGDYVNLKLEDDGVNASATVDDTTVTTTTQGAINVNRIGNIDVSPWDVQPTEIDVQHLIMLDSVATNNRYWDFNQTQGNLVKDHLNGHIAALVNFPVDAGYVRMWGQGDGLDFGDNASNNKRVDVPLMNFVDGSELIFRFKLNNVTDMAIFADSTYNELFSIESATTVRLKANATQADWTLNTALVADTWYTWKLKRSGTGYDITDENDVSIVASTITIVDTPKIDQFGLVRTSEKGFEGVMQSMEFIIPSDHRHYRFDLMKSNAETVPEVLQNQGGTIRNFGDTHSSELGDILGYQFVSASNDHAQSPWDAKWELPDGDWWILVDLTDGDRSGAAFQYFLSHRGYNTNDSFQFYRKEDGEGSRNNAIQVHLKGNVECYRGGRDGIMADEPHWALATRQNNVLEVRTIRKNTSVVYNVNDDFTASADAMTGSQTIDSNSGTEPMYIGMRSDNNTSRRYEGIVSTVTKGLGTFTDQDLIDIANGVKSPTDIAGAQINIDATTGDESKFPDTLGNLHATITNGIATGKWELVIPTEFYTIGTGKDYADWATFKVAATGDIHYIAELHERLHDRLTTNSYTYQRYMMTAKAHPSVAFDGTNQDTCAGFDMVGDTNEVIDLFISTGNTNPAGSGFLKCHNLAFYGHRTGAWGSDIALGDSLGVIKGIELYSCCIKADDYFKTANNHYFCRTPNVTAKDSLILNYPRLDVNDLGTSGLLALDNCVVKMHDQTSAVVSDSRTSLTNVVYDNGVSGISTPNTNQMNYCYDANGLSWFEANGQLNATAQAVLKGAGFNGTDVASWAYAVVEGAVTVSAVISGGGNLLETLGFDKPTLSTLAGGGSLLETLSAGKPTTGTSTGGGSLQDSVSPGKPTTGTSTGGGNLTETLVFDKVLASVISGNGTLQEVALVNKALSSVTVSGNGNLIISPLIEKIILASISGGGNVTTLTGLIRAISASISGGGTTSASIDIAKSIITAVTGSGNLTDVTDFEKALTAAISGNGNITTVAQVLEGILVTLSGGGSILTQVQIEKFVSEAISGNGNALTQIGIDKVITAAESANGTLSDTVMPDKPTIGSTTGNGDTNTLVAKGISLTDFISANGNITDTIQINKAILSSISANTSGLLIDFAKGIAILDNISGSGNTDITVSLDKDTGQLTLSGNGNIFTTYIRDFEDVNVIYIELDTKAVQTALNLSTTSEDSSRVLNTIAEQIHKELSTNARTKPR